MSDDIIIASKHEAEDRAERIRTALSVSWDLIKDAWRAFDWQALGYPSWDAYCDGEFGTSRIRLPREERREVVSSMREIGMSTRAISAATGSSTKTITGDLQQVSQSTTPAPVTGTDGKTYTQQERPRATAIPQSELDALNNPPEPEDGIPPQWEHVAQLNPEATAALTPEKPKRKPLTDEVWDIVLDLKKIMNRLDRTTADDRFAQKKAQIAELASNDLSLIEKTIADYRDNLTN